MLEHAARECRGAPVGVTRGEIVAVEVGGAAGSAVGGALLVHEHDVAVIHRIQLQVRAPPAAAPHAEKQHIRDSCNYTARSGAAKPPGGWKTLC